MKNTRAVVGTLEAKKGEENKSLGGSKAQQHRPHEPTPELLIADDSTTAVVAHWL